MSAALLLLAACTSYRTYPLLTLDVPESRRPLEPTGVAVFPDGRLVVAAEGDARALFAPTPDRPADGGDLLGVFPLHDPRGDCRAADCTEGRYRAGVRLKAQPIRWLPTPRGVGVPHNVEDIAPFGPDRVIGVTEYSSIGRRTGYRKDYIARPRQRTERLFVLQREGDGWTEVAVPEVERLREVLSDWGRANCDDDMLVEGLAWDADTERVHVGLRRCGGPALRVLRYDLGSARRGRSADLEVVADGLGEGVAGPEEGVSGLTSAGGRLWALTAWDSYGHASEPVWGGRLHEVRDGRLHPVELAGPFADRPSALAVLPDRGDDAEGPVALVLFDNDDAAGSPSRPNATVLRARTPRPAGGRFAELLTLEEVPRPLALALNGFDFRWYLRDHRLSNLTAVLDRLPVAPGRAEGLPGAWTRALGGLWQIRVGGSLGLASLALPGHAKRLGHDKQAVAFTDFAAAPGVRFTRYRAALSVVPRDRERKNPSVSRLLPAVRDAYRVTARLPAPAGPGAGIVLQGFEVDTSSRADRGICVAGLELGVDWHDEARAEVDVQATLVGGLCNDFDARGPDLHHGTTTAVDGGVEVVLHFAVVEGAPATAWSASVYDRDVPGPRDADGAYTRSPLVATRDEHARAHLHCARVGTGGLTPLPRQASAAPTSWLALDGGAVGTPTPASALRGFAMALDPVGFDPAAATRALTEDEALSRNNYVYRALLRAFGDADGAFLEGGVSHGLHPRGPMRDNARPSALLLRADMTGFPTLAGLAVPHDIVWDRRGDDPNLQPEDGFIRWSVARPRVGAPTCSPAW